MAGALFLAVLRGGPRHGQRITVASAEDGEPPQLLAVPDVAGVVPPTEVAAGTAPVAGTSIYRLRGRDEHTDAPVYVHDGAGGADEGLWV